MRKLIFTHAGNFAKRFGDAALATLRARLDSLVQFDRRRQIESLIFYVDERASALALGIGVATKNTAEGIKEAIDVAANKQPFDYFLIIGGDAIVPMFRYKNPVDDEDSQVPSDNGYALSSSTARFGPYFVERAVGRLPTGSEGDPQVLWRQLDEVIAVDPVGASGLPSVCVSAAFWEQPSRDIIGRLEIAKTDFHLSPPIDVDASPPNFQPQWIEGRRLQFFNLHGSSRGPEWLGQLDRWTYPKAYEPFHVPPRIQHAVIASEACYGGDIIGTSRVPRSVPAAVCLTCLDNRAAGFCGSSTIAYGGTNRKPTLVGADLVVLYFLQAVQSGKPLGSALLYAKTKLASDTVGENHTLDAVTQKTLLQFCLYGDPSLIPISEDRPGQKALEEFESMVMQARSGRLAATMQEQLARVMEWDDQRKSGPAFLSKPPAEFADWQPQLLGRKSQQLRWSSPAGKRVLSAGGGGAAAAMVPETMEAIWHTEVYNLGALGDRQKQFLVRVVAEPINKLGGEHRLVALAVSR